MHKRYSWVYSENIWIVKKNNHKYISIWIQTEVICGTDDCELNSAANISRAAEDTT